MPQGDGRNGPAARAVGRAAFDHYLRTGVVLGEPARRALHDACERKFNPNHDERGRFASGPGGPKKPKVRKAPRLPGTEDPTKKAHYYQGETANGLGPIEPTSGGYVDANGRYVPEVFPPDPYKLSSGQGALDHFENGGGSPMNFYAKDIDLSSMGLDSFRDIQRRLQDGKAGDFLIQDAQGSFDTGGHPSPANVVAGSVVGGVVPVANGVLTINKSGDYAFSGWVGFHDDTNVYHDRSGKNPFGYISNLYGEQIKGAPYSIYIVGTQPLNRQGRSR